MKPIRLLAGPFAAGLLLPLAFPSPLSSSGFFPLAVGALIPYLLFASRRRSAAGQLAGYLIFSGLHFGIVLYWIPRVLTVYGGLWWPAAGAIFLLLVSSQVVLTAPFPLGVAWMARRSQGAALAAAPGLWLGTELLRDQLPFGGFPWAALGYSQAGSSWLVQAADLGGVYALGFLLVAINALLAAAVAKRCWGLAAGGGGLLAVMLAYGAWRVHVWEPVPAGSVRVGLVQGNLEQYADLEYYAEAYFERLPRLFDRAVEAGAEWVILPEAQNPYRFGEDFYFTRFWSSRTAGAGTWLLLNSASGVEAAGGRLHNSAFLVSPDGETVVRHDKVQLVPFGEYVPLNGFFGLVDSLVDEVSDFEAGDALRLGRVGGGTIAPQICFESLFPWISRAAASAGAQLLVNLTNDGWYGVTAAPWQHLDIARMRAVENRRTMVRATNTGVSAIISPRGEVLASTALYEETVLVGDAVFHDAVSPFSRTGLALSYLFILLTSAQIGWAWRRRAD